jgi:hypothetical protein
MNPALVIPVVYIANHWSQTIPMQQEDRSKHMKKQWQTQQTNPTSPAATTYKRIK